MRLDLQADLAGVFARYVQNKGLLEVCDIEEALRAPSAVGDDQIQRQTTGYVVLTRSLTALQSNACAGLRKAMTQETCGRAEVR